MSALPKQLPRLSPLRPEQLDHIGAIEKSLYEFPWTAGNFRDSLQAGYSCWTCHVDDQLVGYAVLMIAAGEAHLLNISVAPAWQGRGFGKALLEFLMALARERHCERMLLEVRQSNLKACKLYQRNGFIVLGSRKDYYPAQEGREDAIVLERAL
ncbi:MAG: ribosomal protein S18-alanine N-acetyltransferase [Burkholderiales bacterium]|nr:ribosomal protein S18-alanine N-acetyltransferase [Burkholderiales bacterium]